MAQSAHAHNAGNAPAHYSVRVRTVRVLLDYAITRFKLPISFVLTKVVFSK